MVSKKNESHQRHRRCLTLGDEQGPSKGNQQQPSKVGQQGPSRGGRQGHATGKDHPKATGKDHPKAAGIPSKGDRQGPSSKRCTCPQARLHNESADSRLQICTFVPPPERSVPLHSAHTPGMLLRLAKTRMLPSTLHLCTFDLDSIICDP
jgi:hypothetical protein